MLETLLGPLSSLLAKAVGRLAGQPHFKLIASLVTPDYENRPGGYLALGLKIANVGRETAFFDRIEVVYRDGATEGMLVLGLPYETPVNSNRSVVGYLPAKQLLEPNLVDLVVYDAVERSYKLGKARFRAIRQQLAAERSRLLAGGYEVDWQP